MGADRSLHNFMNLIITSEDTIKSSNIVVSIDLVRPIEEVLEEFSKYKDQTKYYTIDTSYTGLEELTDRATIDEIILFGSELDDVWYESDILIMQTILTLREDLDINSLTEALNLYYYATSVGIPLMFSDEVYDYAYDNGILIEELPEHATIEDVEDLLIKEVLEPMGFVYIEAEPGLSGWVDPELLYILGGHSL